VDEILLFLELCAAEVGGEEAKLEVGGDDPDDPEIVWMTLEGGFRLVVRFDQPPSDAASVRTRLATLAESFGDVARHAREALPRGAAHTARGELDALLASVAARVGAERAVVIDESTPVLFGDSRDPEAAEDQEAQRRLDAILDAVRAAGTESTSVREGEAPYLSRSFASIYRVVLLFAEPFSEVHADGHLVRALPIIEKLTVALPPQDPKGGAKLRLLRPT